VAPFTALSAFETFEDEPSGDRRGARTDRVRSDGVARDGRAADDLRWRKPMDAKPRGAITPQVVLGFAVIAFGLL
jgi:hypothetical protein